jgi:hypothetical protein
MTSTFGQGDFGVGNFGTATPVNVSGKGASGGGAGRSRWWLSPLFHPRRAAAAFAGRTRAIVAVWYVRAPVGARAAGRASWRLYPVWHGRPSPAVFSGVGWADYVPKEFRSVALPWGASGRSLVLLHFGGQFLPSPANPGGHAGPFRVAVIWHRGRQPGLRASGRFHAFTAPIAHARGAGRAFGRSSGRLLFTARFLALPAGFSGRAVVSYSWSNTGAPGRTPAPAWGSAIPGASTPWTTPGRTPGPAWGEAIPGADNPWTLVARGAGPWAPTE